MDFKNQIPKHPKPGLAQLAKAYNFGWPRPWGSTNSQTFPMDSSSPPCPCAPQSPSASVPPGKAHSRGPRPESRRAVPGSLGRVTHPGSRWPSRVLGSVQVRLELVLCLGSVRRLLPALAPGLGSASPAAAFILLGGVGQCGGGQGGYVQSIKWFCYF